MAQAQKVLIIEDEQILAENLMTHIQRCGWTARVASTGKLAINAASEFLPQVILLDYRLPDMSGFQALDAIRADRPVWDCVLMTGEPTDTVLEDARRHGIRHILSKPFSLAELETCLSATASEERR